MQSKTPCEPRGEERVEGGRASSAEAARAHRGTHLSDSGPVPAQDGHGLKATAYPLGGLSWTRPSRTAKRVRAAVLLSCSAKRSRSRCLWTAFTLTPNIPAISRALCPSATERSTWRWRSVRYVAWVLEELPARRSAPLIAAGTSEQYQRPAATSRSALDSSARPWSLRT